MELIANVLLAAGAFGAAVYCLVLSRRLSRFTQLENGMGGAIAVLSAQVDDMTRALGQAQTAAGDQTARLEGLTRRAEAAAARLDLLVARLRLRRRRQRERQREGKTENAKHDASVLSGEA